MLPSSAAGCWASWPCAQQMSTPSHPLLLRPPAPGAHQPSGLSHIPRDVAQPWLAAAPHHPCPSRGLPEPHSAPRSREGGSCSPAVPSRPQPLPVRVLVYSAASVPALPAPVFGCMGRDAWYPPPFSISGWQGCCTREGVSPDVPSQLGAKCPARAAAVELPGTPKAKTRVYRIPAHPQTPLALGLQGCCNGPQGTGMSPGCHHRFSPPSQPGVSPAACTGRRVFHLLPLCSSLINYGSSRKLLL